MSRVLRSQRRPARVMELIAHYGNETAGTIRAGVDPDDVLVMMGFMWRIDPKSDWQAQSRRFLDILMDGLRSGAPSA